MLTIPFEAFACLGGLTRTATYPDAIDWLERYKLSDSWWLFKFANTLPDTPFSRWLRVSSAAANVYFKLCKWCGGKTSFWERLSGIWSKCVVDFGINGKELADSWLLINPVWFWTFPILATGEWLYWCSFFVDALLFSCDKLTFISSIKLIIYILLTGH